MRKAISVGQLYNAVNGHKEEMDFKTFCKIIKHMDNSLTEYECKVLFDSFDADHGGSVSYKEFLKAFED